MKKNKEVQNILIALNSSNMFKYPIGNKELVLKTRELESNCIIWYDALYSKWILKGKGVDPRK